MNSRDLRSLVVDRERANELVSQAVAAGLVVVSASGVNGHRDVVLAARAGADAVLVGTVLMRAQFPEDVLEGLTGVAKRAPAS